MPLQIQPLLYDTDFLALAKMDYDAFPPTDRLNRLSFPHGRPTDAEFRATADEDMRRSRMFPNRHYIQCVDESIGTDDNDSREAIAWAVYSSNDSYEAGERQRGPLPSTPSKAISPEGGIDDEDDTAARKAREYATIKAAMREMRRRYIGDKAHIYLHFLGTSSQHRRRGVASMLLEHIFNEARERQRPVYLMATPEAHGMYVKAGFQEIDRIVWPAEPGRGEGELMRALMVWEEE